MKNFLFVFGTRPEAIKMAPLINEFKKHSDQFQTIVCITGQHRDMLDRVLYLFEIVPDYDLNIMTTNQDLYDITSKVLLGMRDILEKINPDVVFVHGDTTTSTATALAAFYQQIPVAHVEAGLRTNNIYNPWPEEMNRKLTGQLTTYHLSPTIGSKANLIKENISTDHIIITGNTVIDALLWVIKKIEGDTDMEHTLATEIKQMGYNIARLTHNKRLVLITAHRRESFGQGLLDICTAIKQLSEKYPNVDFVYPVHLNPNVRNAVKNVFGETSTSLSSHENVIQKENNIYLIEPLDYLPFVYLMSKSYLLLTDSGGIQEEAPALGKPVLVMRDTTERPEGIDAGTVLLIGNNQKNIELSVSELLENKKYYLSIAKTENPFGDGKASERIVNFFLSVLDNSLYN